MESWFVQPTPKRIPLSDGQWILIKTRLTAGEYRAHLRRSAVVGDDGTSRLDPYNHALSQMVAYLLDWSLSAVTDIRGASAEDLSAALDALTVERFEEILGAIEQHDSEVTKERADAKKKTATSGADPTSPSPSVVIGPLTTSAV